MGPRKGFGIMQHRSLNDSLTVFKFLDYHAPSRKLLGIGVKVGHTFPIETVTSNSPSHFEPE